MKYTVILILITGALALLNIEHIRYFFRKMRPPVVIIPTYDGSTGNATRIVSSQKLNSNFRIYCVSFSNEDWKHLSEDKDYMAMLMGDTNISLKDIHEMALDKNYSHKNNVFYTVITNNFSENEAVEVGVVNVAERRVVRRGQWKAK